MSFFVKIDLVRGEINIQYIPIITTRFSIKSDFLKAQKLGDLKALNELENYCYRYV